jgi:MFS family permease
MIVMEQPAFRVYPYRWVVLLVFMLSVAVNQLLWITFAPITSAAASFYQVSDLSIGLLSMSFMIVYIFLSIPASWVIDTYGIRSAVGLGAILTGGFGLVRGLSAGSYTMVLVSQIGIAIGQPFILNSVTKVAARWFPMEERATASGFGTLAIYVGILLGLLLTPFLTVRGGIASTLTAYGVTAALVAATFLLLWRERPPTPPCPPEQEERSLMLDGLRDLFHKRDFVILLIVFFVGLGVFNAVTTWVEEIVRPRGFSITQAGVIGGALIVGGVLGALVMPMLSDRSRRRVPYMLGALVGGIVGLLGVTFAGSYALLLASSALLGFCLLSAGPIGFQYGAEIGYPAPEGTSNGLLLQMGQISGILFIFAMDALKDPSTGAMTAPLVGLAVLLLIALAMARVLRESSLIRAASA